MKLYKGNLITGEFEMSHKEIINKFINSPYNKDVNSPFQSLLLFIGATDGLNSTFEIKKRELANLEKELQRASDIINYYK